MKNFRVLYVLPETIMDYSHPLGIYFGITDSPINSVDTEGS